MNLIRKGHGHAHRGVIGVESAIVMIAFVIVAAALAFVVLNMGFSTTQKAKTTISSGLSEASSTLEVAGKVTGLAQSGVATPRLNATAVPLKIASGGDSVNLDPSLTSIKYLSNTVQFDDIYVGTYTPATNPTNLRQALADAATATVISADPWVAGAMPATEAFIYWSVDNEAANPNNILDEGEHATLAIGFEHGTGNSEERPAALDKMRIEIVVATGAALTVERQVPTMSTDIVDLG